LLFPAPRVRVVFAAGDAVDAQADATAAAAGEPKLNLSAAA
jgi:hypothetical protein